MIRCIEMAPGEFKLGGRVDVTTVADLRTELQKAVDSASPLADVPGAAIRFEVSELELVDAAGLGALVAAHRRACRAGLGFSLVNVPDRLSRLLFISRLYRVLSVEESETFAPREAKRELTPRPRNSGVDGASAILA
jgi:anti-sigma B factor antagonist